ncbi:MAG: D-alanyl-D-alanine carboxypeptidase family protein [Clostridia bacterium]|nr:D-alanyl-D-alanine carboxypeptidase family protein [Clostridia bacterium]
MIFVKIGSVSHALDISAKSAILICADSGSVIFAKNESEPLPMASTTKIMTSLLALENIEAFGDKEIEITDEMVRVEGTSMGLTAGNTVNLETLVQGMMMVSGNDAANAAAIAVAGNAETFVDKMNEKAKLIGMKDTLFCTPSGLDKDDHHSTAYDMAILGAYAMENENFSKIVSQKSMKVHFINPNKYVTMKNHNKLLRLYDGCIGIKTGFTKAAGRCLVSCAQKNGAKLICVTLNAPNDWEDHTKLFNYGFNNVTVKTFNDSDYFVDIPVKGKETDHIKGKGNSVFEVCIKKDDENKIKREIEIPSVCALPIERGQILGNVVYYLGDNVIGKNPIVATDSAHEKTPKKENIFERIKSFFGKIFHFR